MAVCGWADHGAYRNGAVPVALPGRGGRPLMREMRDAVQTRD